VTTRAAGSLIIAVDGGLVRPAASIWRHDRSLLRVVTPPALRGRSPAIAAAALACSVSRLAPVDAVAEVAVEWPEQYATDRVAHENVADLQAMIMFLLRCYPTAIHRRYAPSQWKGNAPKPVIERRLREKFPAEFAAGLVPDNHDAVDALGIGAVYLGLVRRGCV
jgi:hypothetical protein